MANSISLFKDYVDQIDEVYKAASVTSVLDSSMTGTKAGMNANEIVIPKLSMDGLGDYSRNSGYVDGSVTLSHETVAFNYDRGRRFNVDAMDNTETAGVAFGMLSSEFIRTKVGPEQDAFRFATYAGVTGIGAATPVALADGAATLAALIVSQSEMDEAEVPETDRHLFITPTLYNSISALDTDKSREVLGSFASIVKVPQARFYTAIDLVAGTTGGFTKAAGGVNINFFIFHKPALIQYPKHTVDKAISPDDNQTYDGWSFYYRSYGLADVYENKVSGLYLHAATA